MKVYIIWLIGVIAWNFVAVLLSFFIMAIKKYTK